MTAAASPDPGSPWSDPAWRTDAEAWMREQLSHLGIRLLGPVEQPHLRVWSTALRAETDQGTVWLKETAPVYRHEIGVTAALSDGLPDHALPRVLAADPNRGRMLLRDGGRTLRATLMAVGGGAAALPLADRLWKETLTRYSQTQQALTGRVPALLSLGVPDLRLAGLPARYETVLDDTSLLRLGGLTTPEHDALHALMPPLMERCQEIATFGIPETLQHDDLHDNNVLVNADQSQITVFDWGDASISHPFFSLLVVRRSAAHTLTLPEDDPFLDELDRAYLSAWRESTARPLPELLSIAERVRPLAMLSRALTWHRFIASFAPGTVQGEFTPYMVAWLRDMAVAFGET